MTLNKALLAATALIAISACAKQADTATPDAKTAAPNAVADAVLTNGRIMTVSPEMDWAQAVAIKDGRILAVGSDDEIAPYIGDTTRVDDLGGKFAMPGFVDQHVHTYFAGEEIEFGCRIEDTFTYDEVLAKISVCADETPEGEWVRGGAWGSPLLPQFSKEAALAALDKASKGRPLILRDDSAHNVIVNSAALAIIGYDDTTPNPDKGEIVRDQASGKITGLLFESAARAAHKATPARDIEDDAKALASGVDVLNRVGVTSFLDAAAPPRVARAYNFLDTAGGLHARAAIAMSEGVLTVYADEPLEALVEGRGQFKSANVFPDYVKFFLDGVPPTYTSKFIEPYAPTKKLGDHFYGETYYAPEDLARLVTKFDASGATIKIHAAADGSVREALDAFEAARKANGDSGLPHQIAHAGYVHPDDRKRFGELHVIVDACPTLWFPQPIITAIEWAIGHDRTFQYWPFRDIIDQGGTIALGSDWPVLPTPDPLIGLEGMVTRRNPTTDAPEALWPEQAITLEEAVRTATINGAKALNMEAETGSIEVGKSADIIILDENLFEIPADKISDAKIVETIFRGNTVYKQQP